MGANMRKGSSFLRIISTIEIVMGVMTVIGSVSAFQSSIPIGIVSVAVGLYTVHCGIAGLKGCNKPKLADKLTKLGFSLIGVTILGNLVVVIPYEKSPLLILSGILFPILYTIAAKGLKKLPPSDGEYGPGSNMYGESRPGYPPYDGPRDSGQHDYPPYDGHDGPDRNGYPPYDGSDNSFDNSGRDDYPPHNGPDIRPQEAGGGTDSGEWDDDRSHEGPYNPRRDKNPSRGAPDMHDGSEKPSQDMPDTSDRGSVRPEEPSEFPGEDQIPPYSEPDGPRREDDKVRDIPGTPGWESKTKDSEGPADDIPGTPGWDKKPLSDD
jgi:hypothetical protein